ncbi:MAG: hypothetical protein WC683_18770 [bacterium]
MKPSDIQTVAEFIATEIAAREWSGTRPYIAKAKTAEAAFERIVEELTRLQSSVPCSASASVNGNRETGETDGPAK